MFKDDELIGAFTLLSQRSCPFAEKQVELVQKLRRTGDHRHRNTRLLGDLRESLQQQTATADVLKVIAGRPSTSLTVLDTLVDRPLGCAMPIWRPLIAFKERTMGTRQFRIPPELHAHMEEIKFDPIGDVSLGVPFFDAKSFMSRCPERSGIHLDRAVEQRARGRTLGVPLLRKACRLAYLY